MPYAVRRTPELAYLEMRGLKFRVYRWAGDEPQPLVLLHGFADSGATFQFLVDALAARHTLIAFDQRGFGDTQWAQDGYWMPDYLGDLDALLECLSPHAPVTLVGHSLGGNVASVYAGVRPERVQRLINLEGVGLPAPPPEEAPQRYSRWLEQLRSDLAWNRYDSFEQFTATLMRRNPRLTLERADFIARAWGLEKDGRIFLRADPKHRRVNPVLYRRDETRACWRNIKAPTLLALGEQSDVITTRSSEFADDFCACVAHAQLQRIAHAGHMMHHDQPHETARVIEQFLEQH